MEHLIFFQNDKTDKCVSMWSVDPEVIPHLLRGKSFCIKELTCDKLDYVNAPKNAHWVMKSDKEEHASELMWFLENCDMHSIFECHIELEDGCEIEFVAGQLFVSYQNPEQVKSGIVSIMEHYGYFVAENIWDFTIQFNKCIPINTLIGIEPENLTNEQLNYTLERAKEIDKNHIEYEKMAREMDDSEDTMPF